LGLSVACEAYEDVHFWEDSVGVGWGAISSFGNLSPPFVLDD
jgi:hypothetical protein